MGEGCGSFPKPSPARRLAFTRNSVREAERVSLASLSAQGMETPAPPPQPPAPTSHTRSCGSVRAAWSCPLPVVSNPSCATALPGDCVPQTLVETAEGGPENLVF